MKTIVVEEHRKMEQKLIDFLQEHTAKINFAFDGWSSRNLKHFYGLTAHFLNKKWNLISVALDLIPAYKQHSGEELKN